MGWLPIWNENLLPLTTRLKKSISKDEKPRKKIYAETLNSYLIILCPFVVEKIENIQNQHYCTTNLLYLFLFLVSNEAWKGVITTDNRFFISRTYNVLINEGHTPSSCWYLSSHLDVDSLLHVSTFLSLPPKDENIII